MAERRVQVRELDVPSLSSVTPTASPVETYVRPVQEQTQPSALSQFVSAIAPAVQAESEENLRKRLERERKIQAGVIKNQLNQVYQHAVQVGVNLSNDYENNKDTYLNLRDDDQGTAADKLLAIRKQNIDDNVAAMEREGVDELIVQAFKNDMQMIDTAFMKDVYLKDKALQNEEQVYGKFGNSIISVLDSKLSSDSQLEQINQLYLGFVDANQGNHTKALDYIWGIAEERSRSNANNALVGWLQSPQSSPKGQPAQWSVAKRVKQRGVIEARAAAQANASKSALKKQQTKDSLAANAASAYASGNMAELATDRDTLLGMGDTVKHKPEDYIPYFENEFISELRDIDNTNVDEDTKQELTLQANRKRFKFYSTYNLMPPQLSQAVNNGRTVLTTGDLSDPNNLAKAQEMYNQLNMADAYSGGGIITTALKGEDVTRFRHLQALTKGGLDFQAAVGMVQGKIFDGRSIDIDDEEMTRELDTWVPFYKSKASRARNIGVITNEVSKLAEAILQTDETASVESAKRMAMELVTKDYQFIKNTDDSVTAVRIESNALNSPVNVEQIEQGLTDIQDSLELRQYIHNELGVEDRLIGGLGRIVTKGANFDVYIKPGGNPNQLYLYAKPYGEEQEGTQNIFLGSLSIWDFNANRIQGLKDQLLQKYQSAIESEQISAVTSTTPSLQPGGAAGEDDFTTTIANAISQAGDAVVDALDISAQASEVDLEPRDVALSYARRGRPEPAPEEVVTLSPSERRLAAAQAKQEERMARDVGLNEEALAEEVVTDKGPRNWIRSVGTAIGKAIFGGDAQSAELQSSVEQSLDAAATNPVDFILNNRYLGLSEKDPDHQKTIAGFMNSAVKGRVKNPSDMQLDSNAWCAAFAGHVLTSLGLASPQRYDALRAREYLKVGNSVSIDKAKPGDLVVMKRRLQNGKTQWHAGFFVEHGGGKTFKLLGGNQKDQVNVQDNTVANIAGIRRLSGVQNISPSALKTIQREMTFFGKLQNYLLGYRTR